VVVFLGCLAGALFGGVNVAMRVGLRRLPDTVTGGFVTGVIALIFVLIVGLITTRPGEVRLDEAWPFFLIGMLVPGFSQILWVRAIYGVGPSRAAILISTSPLLATLLALSFLSEPFRAGLALGTLLIVSGAISLAWEPVRPHDFRTVGALFAVGVAVCLAFRDYLVRLVARESPVPPLVAATSLLAGACVILLVHYLAARRGNGDVAEARRSFRPFLAAGVLMGLVYVTLVLALDRGRVTVVAPLYSTTALWTIFFAALVLGRSEVIGRRLVFAALLVVAGGALIGASR
jgi:drug/metabolite transporter (DMT)-like permease